MLVGRYCCSSLATLPCRQHLPPEGALIPFNAQHLFLSFRQFIANCDLLVDIGVNLDLLVRKATLTSWADHLIFATYRQFRLTLRRVFHPLRLHRHLKSELGYPQINYSRLRKHKHNRPTRWK